MEISIYQFPTALGDKSNSSAQDEVTFLASRPVPFYVRPQFFALLMTSFNINFPSISFPPSTEFPHLNLRSQPSHTYLYSFILKRAFCFHPSLFLYLVIKIRLFVKSKYLQILFEFFHQNKPSSSIIIPLIVHLDSIYEK